MELIPLEIDGSYLLSHPVHGDNRGHFTRLFCKQEQSESGLRFEINQINTSFTRKKGSIRGLHYQLSPFSEAKIVQCLTGSVFDVMVDLRSGSKTFLKYFGVILDGGSGKSLFIPQGCAHGFQTLEPNVSMHYMHSSPYAPDYERGIRFDDPKIQIDWPLAVSDISKRDNALEKIGSDFSGVVPNNNK